MFFYPCTATSGIICQSCGDTQVDYVTLGECPKPNLVADNSTIKTFPYYCKKRDRENQIFTEDYLGVCAWKIQI